MNLLKLHKIYKRVSQDRKMAVHKLQQLLFIYVHETLYIGAHDCLCDPSNLHTTRHVKSFRIDPLQPYFVTYPIRFLQLKMS